MTCYPTCYRTPIWSSLASFVRENPHAILCTQKRPVQRERSAFALYFALLSYTEAPVGIEPTVGDLQSPALPLGDGAFVSDVPSEVRVAAAPARVGQSIPGHRGSVAKRRKVAALRAPASRRHSRRDSRNFRASASLHPKASRALHISDCAFTGAFMSLFCCAQFSVCISTRCASRSSR